MAMAATIPYYSVADLEQFPNDGNRYELLDGVLLVTPAPNAMHQLLAMRLGHILMREMGKLGVAFVFGPGVVSNPPRTQLEPDVLVVPARVPVSSKWSDYAEHLLAVEIYSPSSRIYDRDFKRGAYHALGVQDVWLVDIADRSIEISHGAGPGVVVRDTIAWRVPTLAIDIRVDLTELFAGIE